MQTNRFSTGRTSWVYQFYKPNCALYSFGLLATRSISLPWLRAYANNEPQTKFIACLSLAVVYCIGAAVLRPYKDNRWLAADIFTAVISAGLVGIAFVASPEENTIAGPPTPGQEVGMWAIVGVMVLFMLFCLVTWTRGLADQLPKMKDFHPTFKKPSLPGKASGLSKASSLPVETHTVNEPPDAAEETGQESDSDSLDALGTETPRVHELPEAAAEEEGQQFDFNFDLLLDPDVLDPDETFEASEASRRFPGASMAAPSDGSLGLRHQGLGAALAEGQAFGSKKARHELELAVQAWSAGEQAWSTGERKTSAAGTEPPMQHLMPSASRMEARQSSRPSEAGDGGNLLPMDVDLTLYSDQQEEGPLLWSSKMLQAFKKPSMVDSLSTSTSSEQQDNTMDTTCGYMGTGSGPLPTTAAVPATWDDTTGKSEAEDGSGPLPSAATVLATEDDITGKSEAEDEAEADPSNRPYRWV